MSYLPVLLVVTQWDYLSGKPTSRASCNIWDETHLGAMPYLPSYNIQYTICSWLDSLILKVFSN